MFPKIHNLLVTIDSFAKRIRCSDFVKIHCFHDDVLLQSIYWFHWILSNTRLEFTELKSTEIKWTFLEKLYSWALRKREFQRMKPRSWGAQLFQKWSIYPCALELCEFMSSVQKYPVETSISSVKVHRHENIVFLRNRYTLFCLRKTITCNQQVMNFGKHW